MTGANYDMIARGVLDRSLTGNPQTTFWRSQWKRHTLFAIESMSQPFSTPTNFGQEAQILLNRVGDMVYYLYLHVTLPGIVACDSSTESCAGIAQSGQFPTFMDNGGACAPCAKTDENAMLDYLPSDYNDMTTEGKAEALVAAKNTWLRQNYGAAKELPCCVDTGSDCPDEACEDLGDFAHYCNDVGHFLISKAKLIIGGQQVDTLWGTFLFCWEELTGKSGRRLTELTGRRYTRSHLICDSRETRDLYIPLPFYFTLNSGSALPLASLSYHGVQINIEFEKLEKLIVVSNSKVIVRNAKTAQPVSASQLSADLEVTYVYLASDERDKFSSLHFETLIVQTQNYNQVGSQQVCRVPLSFNHPTLELIFMVRRECHKRCNNWGNLTGVGNRDPITHAELLLNTTSRFNKKPALYWRGVVPYQHHSNLPEAHIYVMSFALTPEDSTGPSGSCNLSRIDNIELVLDMQSALQGESYEVICYSRSWNLMRFKEGVAGAAFQ